VLRATLGWYLKPRWGFLVLMPWLAGGDFVCPKALVADGGAHATNGGFLGRDGALRRPREPSDRLSPAAPIVPIPHHEGGHRSAMSLPSATAHV